MAIYLKKFDTQAAYEAAQSGLILPNVSLIEENNKVVYNQSQPTPPTPLYVDLGLPSGTLWATMNVGATSETDYGNYYQFGKGVSTYQETSGDTNYSGNENPLAASADTATQSWGSEWRTPTTTEMWELKDNTTFTWETNFNGSGVNGGKFTAQNGNYVFFPAGGIIQDGILDDVGENSMVWSSYRYDSFPGQYLAGFYLNMSESEASIEGGYYYNIGINVRPIMSAQ